jgi:hypothetical protein
VDLEIEIPDNEYYKMEKFFGECSKNTNFKGLISDNVRNMPVFFNAFYQHHIIRDFKKAKLLYKSALLRSECPKGSYQMLCSIFIELFLTNQISLNKLQVKLNKLDEKYGYFMRFDPEYCKTR